MKKPSAADRTISMFGAPVPVQELPVVPEAEETKERVPLEQDVDNLRDRAFKGQEWTTAAFGIPDADGNQYRCSLMGGHYYLETLAKQGSKPAYGYVGLMVHERDLYAVTQVLVQAVRDKQKKESNSAK